MSIATVSRVMNGHHHVASGTRALVHRAVERLGAPVPVRHGAAGGAIYVRCPYVLTDYFGVIVSSITETLELHGRRVVLSAGDAGRRAGVLAGLPQEAGIAGAVLLLPPEPEAELETLRALNFPFVVVDPRSPLSQDIASVSAAHLTAARSVTAHLVQLGHRRIGVIGGPGDWLASQSRIAGHAAALAEAGLLPSPGLLRSVEPTADRGYEAAGELLDLPERPTALIAFNDRTAVGPAGRIRTKSAGAARSVDHRVRRHRSGPQHCAPADDGSSAAGGDGPDGRLTVDAAAGAPHGGHPARGARHPSRTA